MERTQPYGALVLRVALGTMFIAHAGLFTLPGTAQFFQSLGLPGALAYFTFAAELAGGLLILAGLYGRWVSAALVPILLGATWAHAANGWVFTAAHALIGDGAFALANTLHAHKLRQEAFA